MTTRQKIERFKKETKKVSRQTSILLWMFSIATITLFAASFVVPPTGVIDPSCLKAAAWLFALATLAEAREAWREGLGVKLTHGQTSIEVHDLDGPADSHHGGHGHPGYDHNDFDADTDDNGEMD